MFYFTSILRKCKRRASNKRKITVACVYLTNKISQNKINPFISITNSLPLLSNSNYNILHQYYARKCSQRRRAWFKRKITITYAYLTNKLSKTKSIHSSQSQTPYLSFQIQPLSLSPNISKPTTKLNFIACTWKILRQVQ